MNNILILLFFNLIEPNLKVAFPSDLEIDQIVDFLHDVKDVKQRNWRTVKIYVAGGYFGRIGIHISSSDSGSAFLYLAPNTSKWGLLSNK